MNVDRGGLVAGNWKSVNMTIAKSDAWADEFNNLFSDGDNSGLKLVLFPPMSAAYRLRQRLLELDHTRTMIEMGVLAFGGQDIAHVEGEKVRFTGSHHPNLLLDVGMTYVLLGHSERRMYAQEADGVIAAKLNLALKYGLKPILCVGETLEEYEAKRTRDVVSKQLSILDTIAPEHRGDMTIAYEPVWAIGSGKTPQAAEANEVCGFVRQVSRAKHVIYGGSVTSANAADFFGQSEIDGALPGGASEKASEFFGIARVAFDQL